MANYSLKFLFSSLLAFTLVFFATNTSAQNYSGTYNRKDKFGFGRLKITEIKRGKISFVRFELNVGRKGKSYGDYCVGEFKDEANWQSENIAEYNTDFNKRSSEGEAISCRLTFVFVGNTITIRETDCNDYHGVMCNFEGKYSRLESSKPKRRGDLLKEKVKSQK